MNRLVRAGELAHPAERTPIEVLETAVGAAFRPVQLWQDNPLAVWLLPCLKNMVRADLCAEIAALAPGLVNGKFHGDCPIVL